LEGYARTFLLASFRLAGAAGEDPHRFAEWYAQGLAAGVDPANPDRWPRFGECGQAKVEAASIALGLHLTRPWLWDQLSSRTQQRPAGLAGPDGRRRHATETTGCGSGR